MNPQQSQFLSLPLDVCQVVWQHLGVSEDVCKAVQTGLTCRAAQSLAFQFLGPCRIQFALFPLGLTEYAATALALANRPELAKKVVEIDITGCLDDGFEQDLFLETLQSFENVEVLRLAWHYKMKRPVEQILDLLPNKAKLRVLDVSGFDDLEGKCPDSIPLHELPNLTHLHVDFWTVDIVDLLRAAPACLRYISVFWTGAKGSSTLLGWYIYASELVARIRSHAKEYKLDIANLTIDTGVAMNHCETPSPAISAAAFLEECTTEAKATGKMILIQTSLHDYYTVRMAHFFQRVPILAETLNRHFVYRISNFEYPDQAQIFSSRCYVWPSLVVVDPNGEVRCIFSSSQFEAIRSSTQCGYHVDILMHFMLYHREGSYGAQLPSGSKYQQHQWHSLHYNAKLQPPTSRDESGDAPISYYSD